MVKKNKKIVKLEKLTKSVTEWMGSTTSILVHTIGFVAIFLLYFLGLKIDQIMLILTTIVSLEAIYLSLFIQMTVNRNTASLEEVEEDIDEIQADIDEVQTTVEDIGEDVDEISADVDEISADIDEIQQDDDQEDEADKLLQDQNNKVVSDLNNNILHLTTEFKKLTKEIEDLKSGIKRN